ncbi:MAG TPA: histidine phosphatase family protein [Kofleriaceae bacterium]|nr:histidine phosphatase family protein [Kofleriaceae bacterium]
MLFLVRHAEAVDETKALHDPDRHLTAAGRAAARALGERLRWYDCLPIAVWSSPLVRAVQTAELLIAGLGWDGVIESVPALAPGGATREVTALVEKAGGVVIAVGHEPGLSAIGTVITGRNDFPALKKCEAARVETGRLKWILGPTDEEPRKP